jgi:hypothetical protein
MKYVPGEITGTMSGSIGAKTASHNKSGAYFRTRSIPTNPNSIRQQDVRGYFGSLVQAWLNTLSAAQRTGWNTYAENVPMLDKLGQTIYLTGQNHFVRSNVPRLLIGEAVIVAAPEVYNTGEPPTGIHTTNGSVPNTIGIDAGGSAMLTTIEIDGEANVDGDLLLFISNPLNATINYFKGPYQLIDSLAVTATDTSEAWATAFASLLNANGAPAADTYRGLRARIAYDDGRLSQPYELIAPIIDEGI